MNNLCTYVQICNHVRIRKPGILKSSKYLKYDKFKYAFV